MEIKIKKIGVAKGTVGYLAKKLDSQEFVIKEGMMKGNGYHGLWLQGEGFSQFLGGFNQLDITDPDDKKYMVAIEFEDRLALWTDAAWTTLMEIGQDWCDLCNEAIENENPLEFQIKRVEME